jgi:hypothetical protein
MVLTDSLLDDDLRPRRQLVIFIDRFFYCVQGGLDEKKQ